MSIRKRKIGKNFTFDIARQWKLSCLFKLQCVTCSIHFFVIAICYQIILKRKWTLWHSQKLLCLAWLLPLNSCDTKWRKNYDKICFHQTSLSLWPSMRFSTSLIDYQFLEEQIKKFLWFFIVEITLKISQYKTKTIKKIFGIEKIKVQRNNWVI